MKLNVKCSSNGTTLSLEVDGSLRVLGLKELIAAQADVPPENQRLIYSGTKVYQVQVPNMFT